jgi:hypothetical protein
MYQRGSKKRISQNVPGLEVEENDGRKRHEDIKDTRRDSKESG